MSLAIFAGAFFGALLGFLTRNKTSSVCRYVFGRHPLLVKWIGLFLLFGVVLVPSLSLSGALVIAETPFVWGGWLVCSLVMGFFLSSCLLKDIPQES
jgi:hypothetical protein